MIAFPGWFLLGGDKFTDCGEVVQWDKRHLLQERFTFSFLIKTGEPGKRLLQVAEALSEVAPSFPRAVKANSRKPSLTDGLRLSLLSEV